MVEQVSFSRRPASTGASPHSSLDGAPTDALSMSRKQLSRVPRMISLNPGTCLVLTEDTRHTLGDPLACAPTSFPAQRETALKKSLLLLVIMTVGVERASE